MDREFSLTSIEGVVVKVVSKANDNTFTFRAAETFTLDFAQLEIFRNGTADMSDSFLKRNGK